MARMFMDVLNYQAGWTLQCEGCLGGGVEVAVNYLPAGVYGCVGRGSTFVNPTPASLGVCGER